MLPKLTAFGTSAPKTKSSELLSCSKNMTSPFPPPPPGSNKKGWRRAGQRARQAERNFFSLRSSSYARTEKHSYWHIMHGARTSCTHRHALQPKPPGPPNTPTPLSPLYPSLSLVSVYSSRSHSVILKLSQGRWYTWDPAGDDGRSEGVTSSPGAPTTSDEALSTEEAIDQRASTSHLSVNDDDFERQRPSAVTPKACVIWRHKNQHIIVWRAADLTFDKQGKLLQ